MKLVKPKYEIINIGCQPGNELEIVKLAGTTCYQSYEWTKKTAEEFTQGLVDRNHLAMIEFGPDIMVRFTVDRGVTHEIVRHRLFSFAQESTRYVDYSKEKGSYDGEIQFIIPEWVDVAVGVYTPTGDGGLGGHEVDPFEEGSPESLWFRHCAVAERDYRKLRELGWKAEQARSVLPNSLKAEIVVKGNPREWIHFFNMRTPMSAHPQMREVARPLLDEFKKRIPVIFDNIEY